MGNFDNDEGIFLSFIPRGQITNPCPHTFYSLQFYIISFLLK